MNTKTASQQFREQLYHSFCKRGAAALDLVDALTQAQSVESPVALSEEVVFRRRYSSVYDVLEQATWDAEPPEGLGQVLYDSPPADGQTIAGYEVYAVDTTPQARPEADTLQDRGLLKSQKHQAAQPGHKFSWLVRLMYERTSWVGPQAIARVPTARTDTQVAVEQVQRLDQGSRRPKAVVADSLYGNPIFLAVCVLVTTIVVLVRLRHNRVLYEAPVPKPAGTKGAPRKHGPAFKLAQPSREPDRMERHTWGKFSLRLRAWDQLHFRKLPQVVGCALCVEVLKPDGTGLYQRPLWLFWTGPTQGDLLDLARMYFWRFGLEHAFRFFKQHLGLNTCRSTNLRAIQMWMWLCALAAWQLLLMRPHVADARPAWQPMTRRGRPVPLTPRQVQRAAARFLAQLGTPAPAPRPAGKGTGRTPGYQPQPRPRFPVVKKGHKPARKSAQAACSA